MGIGTAENDETESTTSATSGYFRATAQIEVPIGARPELDRIIPDDALDKVSAIEDRLMADVLGQEFS